MPKCERYYTISAKRLLTFSEESPPHFPCFSVATVVSCFSFGTFLNLQYNIGHGDGGKEPLDECFLKCFRLRLLQNTTNRTWLNIQQAGHRTGHSRVSKYNQKYTSLWYRKEREHKVVPSFGWPYYLRQGLSHLLNFTRENKTNRQCKDSPVFFSNS